MLTVEHRSAVYYAGNWSCTTNSCMSSLLYLLCSFCLHSIVLEKWIYNVFVIWWPSLDCPGSNKICVGTVILISFTMDFLDFCSEPMFWEGFKVQTSILLQGHGQSYAMASPANCNNPVSSVTVQYGATLKGKVLVQKWFAPSSKKEVFLHTQEKSRKSHRRRWDDILLLNAGWKTCPSLYVSNNLKRILKMWPPQQQPVYFWHELFVNCHPCFQLKRQNSSYNTVCAIVLKAPPSKLKKLLVLMYDGTLHNTNYSFYEMRICFEGIKTPNK